MLRVLLIIVVVGYVLYKLGFFRVWVHTNVRGGQNPSNFGRRSSDGNVNIDSVPEKDKQKKTFKGGEYVDYEEVK